MEGTAYAWSYTKRMRTLLGLLLSAMVIQFAYSFTKIYINQNFHMPLWGWGEGPSNGSYLFHSSEDWLYRHNIPVSNFPAMSGATVGHLPVSGDKPSTDGRSLELCPLVPPKLVGPLAVDMLPRSFEEIEAFQANLSAGGRWKPRDCIPRHRVAIIIPYRNRESQLKILLHHIHPFLQRQLLDYGIFVIDQAMPSTFNRALLMNIGYAVATELDHYDCFVFHDVDLLPEDDRNLYSCPSQPRHLSIAIDKFQYKLPYPGIFGGASILTKEHMQKTNGFSNLYFGWGGEDDDMRTRINEAGLTVIRYPMNIGRYKMIKHLHESSNKANPARYALLRGTKFRYKTDGVNSLQYEVRKLERRKLFTWVYVHIDQKRYIDPLRPRFGFHLRR